MRVLEDHITAYTDKGGKKLDADGEGNVTSPVESGEDLRDQ